MKKKERRFSLNRMFCRETYASCGSLENFVVNPN